jgi:translation initiation factor eIF-2B subunit alpha
MRSGATKWRSSLRQQTSHFMHLLKGTLSLTSLPHAHSPVMYLPSYKFHRLFPLSQYDLPSHNPSILSFRRPNERPPPNSIAKPSPVIKHALTPPHISLMSSKDSSSDSPIMTPEQISLNNPDVDYTRCVEVFIPFACSNEGLCSPDLISLVFSDVGSLTPQGVSQYLVGMFAG